MTALRSLLFMVGAVLVTAPFGILVPLSRIFGREVPFATARAYCRSMLAVARWTCGIRWEVEGWEHVPKTPAIIMAKHQSAWETLFLDGYFPSQCWVIKKELLWLPFVGWGLMAVRAIAIDRSSGASAREQIVEQGGERLREGHWVTIFPEGTRVAPGTRGRYGIGGSLLATRTGAPILPIAHNAGEFWPRYAFRKHAGVVKVVIGPVIPSAGREVLEVNREVEAWIEGQMRRISPHRYADA